ncbi:E3 ubiquitin-protein ligase rbbp6 [Chytridiales sp. JEL 0842]|nr:E3 ubiquitin-protein ligase rbbp6 [Chytridiales sp. JEL 0842]
MKIHPMQSVVFYKFRSAKAYDQAVFDGNGISVFDLKKEIMVSKKLGKGTDFDLALYNAQTNEEYADDATVIPRNTSILVNRNPPARPGKGTAQKYLTSYMPTNNVNRRFGGPPDRPGGSAAPLPVATVPGARSISLVNNQNNSGAASAEDALSEEQRIAAMFASQDSQWEQEQEKMSQVQPIQRPYQPAGFRPRPHGGGSDPTSGGFVSRPPPPGYVCFRCAQKGHFINECPTIGDQNFDRVNVKRTTGIPKMFLRVVDENAAKQLTGPNRNVMVTQNGELVMATPNNAEWNKLSSNVISHGVIGDLHALAPVKAEFECRICKRNMVDAVKTSCCGTKYCDDCIRGSLLDNEDHSLRFHCPSCKKGLTPDGLVIDKDLRKAIENHIRVYAAGKEKADATAARGNVASNTDVRPQQAQNPPQQQQPTQVQQRPPQQQQNQMPSADSQTSNVSKKSPPPPAGHSDANNNASSNTSEAGSTEDLERPTKFRGVRPPMNPHMMMNNGGHMNPRGPLMNGPMMNGHYPMHRHGGMPHGGRMGPGGPMMMGNGGMMGGGPMMGGMLACTAVAYTKIRDDCTVHHLLRLYTLMVVACLSIELPLDAVIMGLSMSGTIAKKGPRRYISGFVHASTVLLILDLDENKAIQVYGVVVLYGPFQADRMHGDCPDQLPTDAVTLVKMVVLWSIIALGLWLITLAFFLYGGHRKQTMYNLDRYISIWQHRLEWCCFGSRSHLTDSKDVMREVAHEIAHFFHDIDWAPSDIAVGLILLKREQKRITEIKQARRLIVEQPKGFAVPVLESQDSLRELKEVNELAMVKSSHILSMTIEPVPFLFTSNLNSSGSESSSVKSTVSKNSDANEEQPTAAPNAPHTANSEALLVPATEEASLATTTTTTTTTTTNTNNKNNNNNNNNNNNPTSTPSAENRSEEASEDLTPNIDDASPQNVTDIPSASPSSSLSSSDNSESPTKSVTKIPSSISIIITASSPIVQSIALLEPTLDTIPAKIGDSVPESSPIAASMDVAEESNADTNAAVEESNAYDDAKSQKSVATSTAVNTDESRSSPTPLITSVPTPTPNATSSSDPNAVLTVIPHQGDSLQPPSDTTASANATATARSPFHINTNIARSLFHRAFSPRAESDMDENHPSALDINQSQPAAPEKESLFRPWSSRKKNNHHHHRSVVRAMNRGTVLREEIDDILHFVKFAEAAYSPEDVAAFSNGMIKHNQENGLFKTPYFICFDEEMDCFVIAIRGTFSAVDMLVDLKFTLEELKIPDIQRQRPDVTHYAHSGMLITAKNIVEDIRKNDLLAPLIKAPDSPYYDCGLVVTGHSLGGGVASLVAAMLREDYPMTCCYAYSPPGCLLTADAAEYFESFCTTVIMGDDMIPRTSRNSMELLKMDVARLLNSCDHPKWKILGSVLGSRICCVCGAAESSALQDRPGLLRRTSNGVLCQEDLELLKKRTESLRIGMYPEHKTLPMPPVFPPGKILHIEKIRRPPLNLKEVAIDAARGARDAVKAAGEKLKDTIIDGAEGVKDIIIDGAEGIKEKLKDGAEGISEGIRKVVHKPRANSVSELSIDTASLSDGNGASSSSNGNKLRSQSVGDLKAAKDQYESDEGGGYSHRRKKRPSERRSSSVAGSILNFKSAAKNESEIDLERGADTTDDEAPSKRRKSSYRGLKNVKSLEAIYHERLKGDSEEQKSVSSKRPSMDHASVAKSPITRKSFDNGQFGSEARKRPSVTFAELKPDGPKSPRPFAPAELTYARRASVDGLLRLPTTSPNAKPPQITLTITADNLPPKSSQLSAGLDPDRLAVASARRRPTGVSPAASVALAPLATTPITPASEMKLSKPTYPASYAVKKGGVPRAGPAPRRNGKYHYIPRWAKKEEFAEIIVSRSMVADHFPFELLREFQAAPPGAVFGVVTRD